MSWATEATGRFGLAMNNGGLVRGGVTMSGRSASTGRRVLSMGAAVLAGIVLPRPRRPMDITVVNSAGTSPLSTADQFTYTG
jgi:hypothetical protein